MKCINKWKFPQLRNKKDKKKKGFLKGHSKRTLKVSKTLVLIGILGIFLIVGITALVLYIRGGRLDEPLPYSRSARVFGNSVQESSMIVEGMAGDLCVGPSDNPLDGVDGREGEMAGLFAMGEGEIPFSQGIYEQKAPGRLTQLMTLLVAYENLDLNTSVTIEQEDVPYGLNKTCGLASGNIISVRQLLNAVAVYSAEDACMALARAGAGSESAFVDRMNSKAMELGMTNTNYVNPTGAQDENQHTSVYDTYLLLNAILDQTELVNALGTASYTLDYTRGDQESKQRWLDSDNLYVTGGVSLPRGVTVLGGKMCASDTENYAALLVQDNYGNPYAVIVLNTDSQTDFYERMEQMLEAISS